jgi:hypothetical protein
LSEAVWSDQDITDITQVAAMFNLTNRLAGGLDCVPNDEFVAFGPAVPLKPSRA